MQSSVQEGGAQSVVVAVPCNAQGDEQGSAAAVHHSSTDDVVYSVPMASYDAASASPVDPAMPSYQVAGMGGLAQYNQAQRTDGLPLYSAAQQQAALAEYSQAQQVQSADGVRQWLAP